MGRMTVTRRMRRPRGATNNRETHAEDHQAKQRVSRALSTYNTEDNTNKNNNIHKEERIERRNTLRTPIDQWDKNSDSRSTTLKTQTTYQQHICIREDIRCRRARGEQNPTKDVQFLSFRFPSASHACTSCLACESCTMLSLDTASTSPFAGESQFITSCVLLSGASSGLGTLAAALIGMFEYVPLYWQWALWLFVGLPAV
jgi:hypothetical protein